jgi:hypothetical protein
MFRGSSHATQRKMTTGWYRTVPHVNFTTLFWLLILIFLPVVFFFFFFFWIRAIQHSTRLSRFESGSDSVINFNQDCSCSIVGVDTAVPAFLFQHGP